MALFQKLLNSILLLSPLSLQPICSNVSGPFGMRAVSLALPCPSRSSVLATSVGEQRSPEPPGATLLIGEKRLPCRWLPLRHLQEDSFSSPGATPPEVWMTENQGAGRARPPGLPVPALGSITETLPASTLLPSPHSPNRSLSGQVMQGPSIRLAVYNELLRRAPQSLQESNVTH